MAQFVTVEVEGLPPFQVEEGTPPDVIQRIVKQNIAKQGAAAPEMRAGDQSSFMPTDPDVQANPGIKDALKSVGRGVLSATAALPGNSAEFVGNMLGVPSGPNDRFFPNTDEVVRGLKKHTGIDLESPPVAKGLPSLGRSAQEGFGAAVPFSGGGPLKSVINALSGAFGGAAGDIGANVAGEGARGPAAILANLLSQGHALRTPNINRTVKAAVEEARPGELAAAQASANKATMATGVPTSLVQGFDRPSSMEALWDLALQSPKGAPAKKMLADQADVGKGLAERMVADTTGAGTGWKEANDVLGFGKAAIKKPKNERTQGAKPYWDAAENDMVEPSTGKILADLYEKKRIELELPEASQGGKVLTNAQKAALKTEEEIGGTPASTKKVPTGLLDEKGNPITRDVEIPGDPGRIASPKIFGTLGREAGSRADAAWTAIQGGGKGNINKAIGESEVRDLTKGLLEAKYPSWAAANAKQAELSIPVNEMKVSPMERVFDKAMRKSGVGDWGKFSKALNEGPDTIRDVAVKLREADPSGQAFMQIVKKDWGDKVDAAFKTNDGRNTGVEAGKFAVDVAGRPGSTQRANFQEIIREQQRAKGVTDPAALERAVKTAEEVSDGLMLFSRGRGSQGRIDEKGTAHEAGKNWFSALLRTPGWLVGASPAAAGIEHRLQAGVYKQVVNALMSPDGADQLAKIAQYSAGRNAVNQFGKFLIVGGSTAAAHQDKTFAE